MNKDKTGADFSGKTARLSMYNKDSELLAYCDIFNTDNPDALSVYDIYHQITPGTEAIIRWELTFHNHKNNSVSNN